MGSAVLHMTGLLNIPKYFSEKPSPKCSTRGFFQTAYIVQRLRQLNFPLREFFRQFPKIVAYFHQKKGIIRICFVQNATIFQKKRCSEIFEQTADADLGCSRLFAGFDLHNNTH